VNLKNTLKSSVAVAALFAVSVPMTSEAGNITNGKTAKLAISGQIVRAITNADDGTNDKTFQTGGAQTSSRLRWVASSKLSDSVTVGGAIEMNIPHSNAAGSMTLGDPGSDGVQSADSAWAIRHEYIYVTSKTMGKAYIGQTSAAADGSGEANYSGTGMFAGSAGSGHAKSVFFNTVVGGVTSSSTITPATAISNLDHSSRTDVIRYDTPVFMGLKLKTSAIAGGNWDIAGEYNEKIDDIKVRVRAGYTQLADNVTKNFTATGSVAVGHDSGLHVAFAGGKQSIGNPKGPSVVRNATIQDKDTNDDGINDPHFWAATVGYNTKMFASGPTAFAMNYIQTKNNVFAANQDLNEGISMSFQAVQNFSAIGAQVGLEWIRYEYSSQTGNGAANTFDDIDALTLQTVFKF